jgi:CHAT domain-containing protein/tetratricopeptide (TPR) repeat protein
VARADLAGAEPFLRDALAMRRQIYSPEHYPLGHPDLGRSLNNLSIVLRAQGEFTAAEPFARQALAMFERLYPREHYPSGHPDLAQNLSNLGGLWHARGDVAAAEPLLRRALAMYQDVLDVLLAGSSEAEALNHLAQLPMTRDAYLSVTRERPDSAAATYAALWHGRGAVARWLSQRRLAARASDDKARDLVGRLAAKRQALARALLARTALSPDQVRRVRTLSAEKEQLEKELARCLPTFARLLRSARSSPDRLGEQLPEGVVFIDLLRYTRITYDPGRPGEKGEQRIASYVAFVLTRGREVRRVELGPVGPIERAIAAWRGALAGDGPKPEPAPAPRSEAGTGELPQSRLRRLVWEPLARQLPPGTRTVYLVPDGALTRLPWGALPGRKAGTVLLEEHALALLPHGQLLLEALGAGRSKEVVRDRLLVVGDVAYDRAPVGPPPEEERRSRAAGLGGKRTWAPLPATARELKHVRALAGARPVLARSGAEASTEQLLLDLPGARWVHLATHGFFADGRVRSALRLAEKDFALGWQGERVGVGARSPLVLSGLVLAGANRPVNDSEKENGGILTAEAIAGLNLDSLELAVLSACETGLGEVADGEGVFGLQRAFHVAGCKNVVASLWKVDDEATAALMGLFYHKLWQEGLPPLDALRQAQLTLHRNPERIARLARLRGPDFTKEAEAPAPPGPAARAPTRLWAGFVLSGAGR